ncbi:Serine/threonine-protein kinase PrkC [Pirellula sp. SH-Sr6A]|uniref:serine/threonine protein kinase n=1 Tax=Pirellula sp. SH-Sr6A TaxID=1632865 RepID=UPI00078DF7B5|nr:serine/threonine-protein kinase [Pirellula sp. SH-Sr6A]AMV33039.1 Serine/threonine-protein kinase PrkC [Pirellula sp. SH-Sr6A]
MGFFDKLFKKNEAAASNKRVDVGDRFERIRSAVSGTMSNFFVAKDRYNENRIVGVKLCDIDKVEFFESRFKGLNKPSEGQIGSQMVHPNIAKTLEYGFTTKGQPYIVMEYVDGPGLQVLVLEKMEESLRGKRLNLMVQMAEALDYVHKKEFIHRDICPRNYICSHDIQTVKLIDFGLTLPATKPFMVPGNRTGTPLYMAPEIVRRRATDKRVDIFSFGVTCYQLITFELPWNTTETSGKAALQHDTAPPTEITEWKPDLDKTLASCVMNAIKANVEQRTPDMETMLRQLRQVKKSP